MATTPPPPAHEPPKPPPTPPETPVQKSEPASRNIPIRNLEMKATLLLAFTVALILAVALLLAKSRGYFEPKQHLILVADNAEGVVAGMDLTFSGFPIGTVKKFSLGDTGQVRIEIDVVKKDAKWLRTSSVFTLIKNIFGPAQLRAYSGVLTDPPLPDGAERPVLRGDFNEEAARVVGAAKDVLDNLNRITSENSDLNRSMANLQVFTQKLQGKRGALEAVFGNPQDAQKLVDAVQRANSAMAEIQRLAQRGESFVSHADTRVFGPNGLATDAQASVRQLQGLLTDARGSLQRVDAVLKEAQGAVSNVKGATEDLGSLRNEVEASLRRVEDMINDLQRKWPFAKERKIELP
jgi:phospholipid/cholesterol/gamma-HCH transport system substrate-binding protein